MASQSEMRQETHICMSIPGIILEMFRMMFSGNMSIQISRVVLKISAPYDAGHTTDRKAAESQIL